MLVQGGKNPPLAEGGGDPVALDIREQVRVHAPEDDANVFPGQVVEQGERFAPQAEFAENAIFAENVFLGLQNGAFVSLKYLCSQCVSRS